MAPLLALLPLILSSVMHVARGENDYLIGLNVDLVPTLVEENAFIARLQDEFQITLIQTLHGGSIKMLHVSATEESADAVSSLAEVKIIERNLDVNLVMCDAPPSSPFCYKIAAPETWGLDRIDQRSILPSSDPLNPLATYFQGPYRGAGVTAYIVDTGIDINHPHFDNRAYWGFTVAGMGGNFDGHGHGTHVAGTVGGEFYGVAREAILVAVKVFDDGGGSGTDATVISGLKWVLDHHNAKKAAGLNPKSVANLSIGGGASACMDFWLRELIDAGVIIVVAGGNNNDDACFYSPAREPEAITVGASDVTDTTSSFSNWGSCLDLYAPGSTVKSLLPIALGSLGTKSGTSMATPHVTGVVALKLSKDTVVKTQAEMVSWLIATSSLNKLTFYDINHATSENRLLFVDCTMSDIPAKKRG